MNTIQAYYPTGPINVSPEITNPSDAFKTEVKKVMSSILLFFILLAFSRKQIPDDS